MRPSPAHPFLLGLHPEHVGLFVPQDAAFTHLHPVRASPQAGTTHHPVGLGVGREGDGVLRAAAELVSRDQNLAHFVSELTNHHRRSPVAVARRTLKSVTHRKQELKFQEKDEPNLKEIFIFIV